MIKALKYLFLFIFTLVFLTVTLIAIVWFNLELIITSDNIIWAQKKYASQYEISWDDFDADVANHGFFNKSIQLKSSTFQLKKGQSDISLKDLNVEVFINPLKIGSSYIKTLKVEDTGTKIYLEDFINPNTSTDETYQSTVQQITSNISLLKYVLGFFPKDIGLNLSPQIFSEGKVFLTPEIKALNSQIRVKAFDTDLSIVPSNETFLESKKIEIDVISNLSTFKIESHQKLDLSFPIEISGDFQLKPSNKEKESSLDLNIGLNNLITIKEDSATFLFKEIESQYPPYISQIFVDSCSVEVTEDSGENIKFKCPRIQISPVLKTLETKWSDEEMLSDFKTFVFKLNGSLSEKLVKSVPEQREKLGHVEAKLDPFKTDKIFLDLAASIDLFKKNETYDYQPTKVITELEVYSFQSLVRKLRNTSLAIPAPFHEYTGELKFKTKDLSFSLDSIEIPFQAHVNLQDKSKTPFELESESRLKISKSGPYKFTSDVSIDSIGIRLPDFDPISGLPALTGDSRIQEKIQTEVDKKSQENKPSNLKMNLDVTSKSDKAIKIYYKLFKPYMPLGVKANVDNNGTNYKVFTKTPWTVSYLKRDVTIQALELKKESKYQDSLFTDTVLLYKASGYKIYISIVGNIDEPNVSLRSDPPLSRKDIISVLIYNRTSDDLTRFQNESVGSTNSAFADKAIGLIGIWAFASTPIESVSYDSKSNIYRAQIALPGGVKFDIGTDWEKVQNLSLRKRVSKYWTVVTSYEPSDEEQQGVGNIFLQREWIF